MTVKQLFEECNIDMWQHVVVKHNREVLGGGFRPKILKRYGNMEIETMWCVKDCLHIKVKENE